MFEVTIGGLCGEERQARATDQSQKPAQKPEFSAYRTLIGRLHVQHHPPTHEEPAGISIKPKLVRAARQACTTALPLWILKLICAGV